MPQRGFQKEGVNVEARAGLEMQVWDREEQEETYTFCTRCPRGYQGMRWGFRQRPLVAVWAMEMDLMGLAWQRR